LCAIQAKQTQAAAQLGVVPAARDGQERCRVHGGRGVTARPRSMNSRLAAGIDGERVKDEDAASREVGVRVRGRSAV
ncbi:unnamed protein product, partial [Urochloa humidicola]